MSHKMGDKLADAGHAAVDAMSTAGHKVAQGAENAVEFVKDKIGLAEPVEGTNLGVAGVKEHMNVIASCGKRIGVVDRVEGRAIKLTKKDSPDGQHHYIPLDWIERVDRHVHLIKNSKEAEEGWKADSASCACSS